MRSSSSFTFSWLMNVSLISQRTPSCALKAVSSADEHCVVEGKDEVYD